MNNDETLREEIAVICGQHGRVHLTTAQYNHQLFRADTGWWCPVCGDAAAFDEDLHQDWLERNQP